MHVCQARLGRKPVCFIDERFADLNAELVPLRLCFCHAHQKTTARTANIEQERTLSMSTGLGSCR
jgi:hypothetical protein